MQEKWIENITIEAVPDKYREIAETIGVKNFIRLSGTFGGGMMYIPKYDTLTKEIRNDNMKKEFNGCNYKELAKKYNLSESQVRSIINSTSMDGQMSIF